jgi:SAM-dependent methyltransferase
VAPRPAAATALWRRRGCPAEEAPCCPRPDSAINGTLKRSSEWKEARAIVEAAGLPAYDRPPAKSWDALRACTFLLHNVASSRPVLDVGGVPDYSYVSTWLAHHGFEVEVINPALERDFAALDGRVRYTRGDGLRTPYPDGHFAAATCLSVIEHGVERDPFFREMHRVVAPGGYLIVSTDFWHEPIDTGDRQKFGAPVRIFTPSDIEAILERATFNGFRPTGLIDYRCEETTVEWLGLRYTFLDFALRRLDDSR